MFLLLFFSDFVLIFQLKNRYEKRFINGWPPAGNMEENVVRVAIWIVTGLADRNIRRTRSPKKRKLVSSIIPFTGSKSIIQLRYNTVIGKRY